MPDVSSPTAAPSPDHERLLQLEAEVAVLREQIAALQAELTALSDTRS